MNIYITWLTHVRTERCQFVSIRHLIKGACRVTVWAIVGAMLQRLIFCGGNCPHCPWASPVPPPMVQIAISEHARLHTPHSRFYFMVALQKSGQAMAWPAPPVPTPMSYIDYRMSIYSFYNQCNFQLLIITTVLFVCHMWQTNNTVVTKLDNVAVLDDNAYITIILQ